MFSDIFKRQNDADFNISNTYNANYKLSYLNSQLNLFFLNAFYHLRMCGKRCGRVKQTTVYRNEKEDIMANIHVTFNKYGM